MPKKRPPPFKRRDDMATYLRRCKRTQRILEKMARDWNPSTWDAICKKLNTNSSDDENVDVVHTLSNRPYSDKFMCDSSDEESVREERDEEGGGENEKDVLEVEKEVDSVGGEEGDEIEDGEVEEEEVDSVGEEEGDEIEDGEVEEEEVDSVGGEEGKEKGTSNEKAGEIEDGDVEEEKVGSVVGEEGGEKEGGEGGDREEEKVGKDGGEVKTPWRVDFNNKWFFDE
ncbi:unknown [Feldmannia species virus]|uniref:Uncharacterized protein n=1 Tax=Feldmannia species virus TaxID=39420 RepID=B5LWH4_9PHYC|nr:hypothetical protein FeldSpV_gp085 [Feldmannia species virus]ACH46837.1 unknown [Feldmannia species virus]